MGQINTKNTDTPITPSTGWTGLYFTAAGVAKRIDDAGAVSDLAAPSFVAASERENNTVLFDQAYITGNANARSGNILFDFTGAQLGAWTEMKHNDSSAFTFPSEAVLMFDSADISTSADNYFLFVITDITSSSEVVKVFHQMVGGVS